MNNPFLPDVLKAKWILAASYNLKMQLGLARSDKHDKPKIVVSIHSSNTPKRDRMDKNDSDASNKMSYCPTIMHCPGFTFLWPPMKPPSTDKISAHIHQLPDSACGCIYEHGRTATLPTHMVDLKAT